MGFSVSIAKGIFDSDNKLNLSSFMPIHQGMVWLPMSKYEYLKLREVYGVPETKIQILGLLNEGDKTINELLLRIYQMEMEDEFLTSFPKEWGASKYHNVYKHLKTLRDTRVSVAKKEVYVVSETNRDGEHGQTAEKVYRLNVRL